MKNIGKIMNFIEKNGKFILILSIAFIMPLFILWIWKGLHDNSELLIGYISCISYIFLFIFLAASCYAFIGYSLNFFKSGDQKYSKSPDKILKLSLLLLSLIPIIITLIIFGLLIIDLTIIFSTFDLEKIYQNTQTKEFLIKLYAVGLGVVVFGVQLYAAYVRGMALKQANETFKFFQKQFTFTQRQFNYTQIQKNNEDIDKRFQEGIKLLGNDNESIRSAGIYILWDIVKEAVNALPYLEKKHNGDVKLFCFFKDEEFKDDMDINNYIEISTYKKNHSLHTQILDILCAYVRTQTNSEEYLRQYSPSIYQVRYPKQFKESFWIKWRKYFLLPKDEKSSEDEKPSNEIQTLIDLLTKKDSNGENLVQRLGFILNFNKAVLNGISLTYHCFDKSLCEETSFKGATIYWTDFISAYLKEAIFDDAKEFYCNDFSGSICFKTRFKKIDTILQTNFMLSDCREANFTDTKFMQVKFHGAKFYKTKFSLKKYDNSGVTNALDFSGVNAKYLGYSSDLFSEESDSIRRSDGEPAIVFINHEGEENPLTQDNINEMNNKLFINQPNFSQINGKQWRIKIRDFETIMKPNILTKETLLIFDSSSEALGIKIENLKRLYCLYKSKEINSDHQKLFNSCNYEDKRLLIAHFEDFDDFDMDSTSK